MSLSFSSLFSISRVKIFAENSVLDRCVNFKALGDEIQKIVIFLRKNSLLPFLELMFKIIFGNVNFN